MDAYAFLLDRLKEDGCHRLRSYVVNPNSKFTTWLVVVARRICVDKHRLKYGRLRDSGSTGERARRNGRRRLEDLADRVEDGEDLADENNVEADRGIEVAELSGGLTLAMSTLPSADLLLIRLRFEDGLSAAEIAEVLRYPSQFHVYRRINSILASLRTSLRSCGFESAAS